MAAMAGSPKHAQLWCAKPVCKTRRMIQMTAMRPPLLPRRSGHVRISQFAMVGWRRVGVVL